MKFEHIIKAFAYLGAVIEDFLLLSEDEQIVKFPELSSAIRESRRQNAWFVNPFVINALKGIRYWLDEETLAGWITDNDVSEDAKTKKIGLIMAGNIPLVGFHDFLSVLLTGNKAYVKMSSKDTTLLPVLSTYLVKSCPNLTKQIHFVEELPKNMDAIIATGSNNTMRYFSYQYEKIPHILRGSRSSIAVLTGEENSSQIDMLTQDICLYFGMGCRSVTKIYIPDENLIPRIQNSLSKFTWMTEHRDWADSLRFQKAVMLTRGQSFYDCGPVVMLQESRLISPMAVIHYEKYSSLEKVKNTLKALDPMVQCVVGDPTKCQEWIPFGKSLYPEVNDFADRVNTLSFINSL